MSRSVTLQLDDELLAKAEAEAERRKVSLPGLLEAELRKALAAVVDAPSAAPFVIEPYRPTIPGYAPGIPPDATLAELLDALDAEDAEDQVRSL